MAISSGNNDQSAYRKSLGLRIALVVAQMESKQAAATAAGVTPEQLNKWIRGQVKVPVDALKSLAEAAKADFSWLATGLEASHLARPIDATAQSRPQKSEPTLRFDDWTMRRMATVVTAMYGDRKVPISPENVAVEAALLYNEMVARVSDLSDRDEIEAMLPQLRHLMKKRLDQAGVEPGTGKASA